MNNCIIQSEKKTLRLISRWWQKDVAIFAVLFMVVVEEPTTFLFPAQMETTTTSAGGGADEKTSSGSGARRCLGVHFGVNFWFNCSGQLLFFHVLPVEGSTYGSWPTRFGVNQNLQFNWKSWILSTVVWSTVELQFNYRIHLFFQTCCILTCFILFCKFSKKWEVKAMTVIGKKNMTGKRGTKNEWRKVNKWLMSWKP